MRINALEKEVERYKTQLEAEAVDAPSESSSVADLLRRISILEKVCHPEMSMLIGVAKQDTQRRTSCPRVRVQQSTQTKSEEDYRFG